MGHSRKPKSNNLLEQVREALSRHTTKHCQITVGLSGGVDSVVLFHALLTLSKQACFTLSAVHVNHGISQNAGQWAEFCHDLCQTHGIPIETATLSIQKSAGISLEAAAREERYQIFSQFKTDYIALAQHADDQVETVLLQLLRGAGVKGLSAMPAIRQQIADTAPQILRPLLNVSRTEIEAYAQIHQLNWVTDESNDDITFNRNFLRHKVLPVIKQQYPTYQTTIMRSSQHLAEASSLLDELAQIDMRQCTTAGQLNIDTLRQLSTSRAKNLLRYMFSRHNITLPSTAKLTDILNQLITVRQDKNLHIVFGKTEIRCYQNKMYLLPKQQPVECGWSIPWHNEKQLIIPPLNGVIDFSQTQAQGIDPKKLQQAPVTIRLRQGGEKFQPDCKRPRRSLKKLLQEAAMPPWERERLPLLFSDNQLVWVPGIGIDCHFQAPQNTTGLVPTWQPGQHIDLFPCHN